ncbi:hypothetical protein ACFO5Q_13715 [Kordiimonas lipolytica]|uniref:Uncharacterized protein n=1 Tax=Kordiimonas lipolytica TaxID=1662421 RepID=A0ABV8UCM0_9PROT|nr:hypothetical protein [Kordiimonas lipolytica]
MLGFFADFETLKTIPNIPASSRTFQLPVYAQVGDDLFLSYYTDEQAPGWEDALALDPAGAMSHMAYAVLRFHDVLYFSCETYEDDTIREHRLAEFGLKPFSQYVVEHSALVERLFDRQEKSTIKQQRYPREARHFIFTMHGHVFELVAAGFELARGRGSLVDAIAPMVTRRMNGHAAAQQP